MLLTIWLNNTRARNETKRNAQLDRYYQKLQSTGTKLYVRERASGMAHVDVAGALRSGFVRLSCNDCHDRRHRCHLHPLFVFSFKNFFWLITR